MEVTFDQLMQLFWWGTITISIMCLILLSAVALASFVVFRTRRDGPERLFTPREQQGDAGQVGDAYSDPESERSFNWLASQRADVEDDDDIPEGSDVMKSDVMRDVANSSAHDRFMDQVRKEGVNAGKK